MEGANASLQGLKQNPTDEVMFRSESKLPPSPRLRRGVVEGRKFGSWKLEVGSWELGVGSWKWPVGSYHRRHGRLRASRPHTCTGRQHERPDRALRKVSEEHARTGRAAVARRAGAAGLRERFGPGVEAVGRTAEDDSERVPADALAEGSAGADQPPDGRFLLRRERGAAPRVRAAADEVVETRDPAPGSTGSSRSMAKRSLACASRSVRSTAPGVGPCANRNPR